LSLNTLHLCKSCIINLAGHMQVNKSNEKLLPKQYDTVIVDDGRRSFQSNHMTEGPAQAKLCCYDE
jgi:hypothetical protein